MEALMDTLDELRAVEQIKQLKARYFRCMDTKDWDGFQAMFARDASMDTTQEAPDIEIVHGDENIRRFVEGAVGPVVTVHHGHMPEIDVTGPTTATGIWALQDLLVWPNGLRLLGFGHYHETYEKVGGEWRIASSKLTRLHMDFTDPGES
jgi:SnoaL-like domain